MMIARENNQNGRKFTVVAGRCCLHTRCSSICNLSFHKVFVLNNIPAERVNSRTWKTTLEFTRKEVWCKGVLTAQGMSHFVVVVLGCLFMQASYAPFTYVIRDPLTDLPRIWSLWLPCGGNSRAILLALLYYLMDKCKSWFSSNRTIGLSSEGLACATKCFTYLTQRSSFIYPDGQTVCYMCWMYSLFNDSVDEIVMSACRTLLQYIVKILKEIWKSFAALLDDFPLFRTALSHLVSVSEDVCCCCLASSCQYALFSFSKRREKRADW